LKPGQDKAQLAKEFDDLATIHGGYWRYGFVDHSYLYNLYFPPAEFFEMLQSNIHALVQNYPVAQTRLAGWLGELIEQAPEHIVVGNGAAELIKIISAHVSKKLIVPTPTFNEYVNAAPAGHVVEFSLDTPSYDLDVDKFVNAAKESKADVAVVVSPNNPTSKLIPKSDLLRLIAKLAEIDCMLVVDESFIDFVEDRDQVTLERDIKQYDPEKHEQSVRNLRTSYWLHIDGQYRVCRKGTVRITHLESQRVCRNFSGNLNQISRSICNQLRSGA
jgi:histidinol-phosphate/aromatic aminotransferase/cobyric acid decarboxylase-like protein